MSTPTVRLNLAAGEPAARLCVLCNVDQAERWASLELPGQTPVPICDECADELVELVEEGDGVLSLPEMGEGPGAYQLVTLIELMGLPTDEEVEIKLAIEGRLAD
jgi:hypothetical protein